MATRIQQEVWALDRCSGCGACVAACSKGVLYWGQEQHPLLEERQKALGLSRLKLRTCEVCDRFCELSCPRLVEWTALEPRVAVSARAAGALQGGGPNHVLRALLVAARASDLIDGAIVLDLDPWTLQPLARIVTEADGMAALAGMQYLWAPVLSQLNEAIFERGLSRLAVAGSPCVAEGARRLLESENGRLRPYRQAIRLTIASFCTGMVMPGRVSDLLQGGLGLAPHQIRSLTADLGDGSLVAALWEGGERRIPLPEVQGFTRHGCGSCHDYLGESADLAVGAIGALPAHATLIARTGVGEALLRRAESLGLLNAVAQVDQAALAQARAQKDRRERAEALAELRILMLDGLGDPQKRAEVRKQFESLCGAPRGGAVRREQRDGGCGRRSCSGC